MNYEEALAWLRGDRSMLNVMMEVEHADRQTTLVAVAEVDAAMTQQAYWIVLGRPLW